MRIRVYHPFRLRLQGETYEFGKGNYTISEEIASHWAMRAWHDAGRYEILDAPAPAQTKAVSKAGKKAK